MNKCSGLSGTPNYQRKEALDCMKTLLHAVCLLLVILFYHQLVVTDSYPNAALEEPVLSILSAG